MLTNVAARLMTRLVGPTEAGKAGAPGRHSGSGVTDADRAALRPDNRELVDLIERYSEVPAMFGRPPIWHPEHVRPTDLLFFRGDNAYVWQYQDRNRWENYLLTYFHLKQRDHLNLFRSLVEDGDFGVFTFATGELDDLGRPRLVSRDLLDSISEILFLDRTLGLSARSDVKVLDIGAGYGRLAYRATTSLSSIAAYYCIDAVPQSTFLARYYLARKGAARATSVPFDRQDGLPGPGEIHLAINIHNFSECSIRAVDYWVRRCRDLEIEFLFVVPDMSGNGGDRLLLTDGTPFDQVLTGHGYRLHHAEPKYANPAVQRCGVSPAWNYLFRRGGGAQPGGKGAGWR